MLRRDHPKIICQDQRLRGFDHKTSYNIMCACVTPAYYGRGLSPPSAFLVINELVIFLHIKNLPNGETHSVFASGDRDKDSISATFCVDFNVVSCFFMYWIGVAEISRQSGKGQQLHQSVIVCSVFTRVSLSSFESKAKTSLQPQPLLLTAHY